MGVENGIISLPKGIKPVVISKDRCPSCAYFANASCSGPESKTSTATIHDSISFNPTDAQILANAKCLREEFLSPLANRHEASVCKVEFDWGRANETDLFALREEVLKVASNRNVIIDLKGMPRMNKIAEFFVVNLQKTLTESGKQLYMLDASPAISFELDVEGYPSELMIRSDSLS